MTTVISFFISKSFQKIKWIEFKKCQKNKRYFKFFKTQQFLIEFAKNSQRFYQGQFWIFQNFSWHKGCYVWIGAI